MARKKIKNFKLEQDELKPLTIGIFESRKKSSLGIFVILTFFVLVIFFLPEISDYINDLLYPKPSIIIPNDPVVPVDPDIDDNPSLDDSFYLYSTDLKIANDDISVDGFAVDTTNNTLTYKISNIGNNTDIEALNYYIEIYNGERTLIERVKLANNLILASGSSRSLTRNISNDAALNIGYVVLIKKTIAEYPEVSLTTSEDGNSLLVCSKEHEKITYKFENEKLKELTSVVSYSNTDNDYEKAYDNIKTTSQGYNSKTGVSSTLIGDTTNETFSLVTNVNLNEASRFYIFNADSFKLDTIPKVVNFEMEAQGFKCE